MSPEVLTLVFMGVVLKIPLVGLAWVVWWALRAEPELEGLPDDGDGGSRVRGGGRPLSPRPFGPRRGPGAVPVRPVPSDPHGGRPPRSQPGTERAPRR